MGVILDSSVIITAERRALTIPALLEELVAFAGNQDAALSSIGLTELVHGVYRAQSPERQRKRQAYLDELLRVVPVHPYTSETAALAGRLDGEQQALGICIPFADLLIGATALSLGYTLLTSNIRHFRLIPGLSVLPFALTSG